MLVDLLRVLLIVYFLYKFWFLSLSSPYKQRKKKSEIDNEQIYKINIIKFYVFKNKAILTIGILIKIEKCLQVLWNIL
jgi:hypothetical protein